MNETLAQLAIAAALCIGAPSSTYVVERARPLVDSPHGRSSVLGPSPVAALLRRGSPTCSAVLIAPKVLMTAGHCLGADLDFRRIDVVFGSPIDDHTPRYRLVDGRFAPGFEARTLTNDLALLQLMDPAPVPPVVIVPSPLTAGAAVGIEGFGGLGRPSTWRSAGRARVTEDVDTFLPAPANACRGDSGGGIFGGDRRVAAIVSRGSAGCTGAFKATALTSALVAFGNDYVKAVERASAPGERCWTDAQCREHTCYSPSDAPNYRYCVVSCSADGACPSPLACDASSQVCRHALPSPGALGTKCDRDWDCGDGVCAHPKDVPTRARTCMRPCVGLDLGCPQGQRCVPANVVDRSSVEHVCWAKEPYGGGTTLSGEPRMTDALHR